MSKTFPINIKSNCDQLAQLSRTSIKIDIHYRKRKEMENQEALHHRET